MHCETQSLDRGGSMNRVIGIVGLAVLAAACGGGGGGGHSTAAPTRVATPAPVSGWPAGTVVQLVNAETGAAVQGQLNVGGVMVDSGAPLASAVAPGVTLDVIAAGFLPRLTTVKTGVPKIGLWPDDERITANYSHALVYGWGEAENPLYRLPPKVRSVAISGDYSEIESAAAIINAATARYGVTFFAGGTGDMTVPVRLDPTAETCQGESVLAFARIWTTNQEISRGEIIVCAPRNAISPILAHEMGHVLGLAHSEDQRDMMGPYQGPSRGEFTDREITVIGLMMQRRGGNTWPDNDRTATATGVRRHDIVN